MTGEVEQLGDYKIVQKIGQGGFGEVFKAVHVQRPDVPVAIKVLRKEHVENAQISARFVREAKLAQVLSHKSIIRLIDYVQLPNACAFIAMEYVAGVDLRRYFSANGGKLTPGQVIHIFRQIAEGVSYAHGKGVIHRDLKLGNIMLVSKSSNDSKPEVKVLDFGIAKTIGDEFTEIGTSDKMLLGTYEYLAPEQFENANQIDGRADVYSLGVMIYYCLAGRPPFRAGPEVPEYQWPQFYLKMHRTVAPPHLADTIPKPLAKLTLDMLAKSVKARPTMSEVVKRFDEIERSLFPHEVGTIVSNAADSPTLPISQEKESSPARPAFWMASGHTWMIVAIICLVWALGMTIILLRH